MSRRARSGETKADYFFAPSGKSVLTSAKYRARTKAFG
jgi:hypothetical protein